MKRITLPADVNFIIERLNSFGYRADAVGGAVRDALLLRPVGDYDITTDAAPEKVKDIFSDFRTVDTGIKHGTVTLIIDRVPYEITTYRLDGEYKDNRHPESVTFTASLEEDLKRRDFTVNAMAYSERYGLCDLFGGQDDLRERKIRAVGDAELRFSEDALRILRALRFASVLDFTVEDATARAVRSLAPRLGDISVERIYKEWVKLLSGVGAYRIISEFSSVISLIIPELSDLKLPEKTAFLSADGSTRMLSLYALSTPFPSLAFENSMRRLKTDTKTRETGKCALSIYKDFEVRTDSDAQRLLSVGERAALAAIRLRRILGLSDTDEEAVLLSVIKRGLPTKVSDLALGGGELMLLGYKGRDIALLLSELLELVIDGECINERDALIACAKRKGDKNGI